MDAPGFTGGTQVLIDREAIYCDCGNGPRVLESE
ncbi:hypothetical protein SAMN05216387_101404 [Nitrosovibrio tenuis]|uniref:Uncharacterized protein n=1 Tax=Nitrosovibrio tenuis TaxID=1233 RepID=A0A1H7GWK8_9PROT|nr:hypothetical protein SAMN05216387_101404 [Nitrosovibrio tenuis]